MRNLAHMRESSELFMRFGPTLVVVLLTALFGMVGSLRWGLVFTIPLLVVAVYDFCQRRHTLWRNYPLLAHVRWMMEDLRPYARAYLVEGDLEGRPFNHQ